MATTTSEGVGPAVSRTTQNRRIAELLADRSVLTVTLDGFAAAFSTLSQLLATAPSAAVLDAVRAEDMLAAWPLLQEPDCRRGTALLAESATAGEDETAVRRDYNRLFFGPERMKAPPYESVHLAEDGLVFGRETMLVRAAYAQFGLSAPNRDHEPDDHISLELGFLATLAVRGLDALEQVDDVELGRVLHGLAEFLDEHLLRWGPACLRLAADASTSFFYQGVASLGLGTLSRARTTFLP